MSNYDSNAAIPDATADHASAVGAGLRDHMLWVYNYMALGVGLTGVVAMLFAPYARDVLINQSGTGMSGLGWIITLAPLGFVMVLSFGINRLATSTAQLLYWAFAVVMGLSMSTIFITYTNTSIAQAFFAAAAAFAGLSLYGYTTKRDLIAFGTFLIMGVVGLIIASLINMWVQSTSLMWAISALGVLIFAGLTAYDTQRLKASYSQMRGTEWAGKMVILGALQLYLDFINMFLFLLRFMGNNRS